MSKASPKESVKESEKEKESEKTYTPSPKPDFEEDKLKNEGNLPVLARERRR